MASPAPSIALPSRVIRVFVSSTFRDMKAERDELVKRTFPQLRRLCETRGVTWGEVDLRWGVTDEQKSEGKVLPICLAEIRRCRPYFIGLLGERYGWVPEEVSPALLDEEQWLGELRGRSVTELEILHGVLNNSAMAENAFFYFRSPAYLDSLPREQRPAFQESATPDDIAQFGAEEAERRAEERKQKLTALKERIRGSGLPVREGYANPRALGEMVLGDLTSIIDRAFPEGSAPDPLDREAAEQEAFAQSRARVYIGRPEYFGRLDAHAGSDGPPLIVLGESGLGKSALLANWAMRYRVAHPHDLLVQHFIGATPASADWAAMLRRILGEFKRRFSLTLEIPDKPDALRLAFANTLHIAAARGRVVLILDALNQLEDRDEAPDLVWLPPEIPANVRLILSTLRGRPLDDLKRRDWPVLQVEPLDTSERKQLVNEYLAQYTKSLDAPRVERIAAAPPTANPLYLRALLEELRLWHEHETLEERIDHYLSAATVGELYQRILERYEQDYERDRPGLVSDAMSLLWAARRGLSEAELMDLLGSDGQPLPRAHWSPLYLAAEQSLVNRSGLIGFFHDYFREAVRERYLPAGSQQQAIHLRLAAYFEMRELGDRKVDELPWQLSRAGSWKRLYDLLGDLRFFAALWHEKGLLLRYWLEMEENSTYRMAEAFMKAVELTEADPDGLGYAAEILDYKGLIEQAIQLVRRQVAIYRQQGNRPALQHALNNLAGMLANSDALDEGRALISEAEALSRSLRDTKGLAHSLGNQACLPAFSRIRLGDFRRGWTLLKQQERLCRDNGYKGMLFSCLINQVHRLVKKRDYEAALPMLEEAERISRESSHSAGMLHVTFLRGDILIYKGDLKGALSLFQELERLARELGAAGFLRTALNRQNTIQFTQEWRPGKIPFEFEGGGEPDIWRLLFPMDMIKDIGFKRVAGFTLFFAAIIAGSLLLYLRVYALLAGTNPILASVVSTFALLTAWFILFIIAFLLDSFFPK